MYLVMMKNKIELIKKYKRRLLQNKKNMLHVLN
jgi:hypothetical protein